MKRFALVVLSFVLVAAVAFAATSSAWAKRPPSEPGCFCPDVFAPVLCADGNVYSNACVASCNGQTDCVPAGDQI